MRELLQQALMGDYPQLVAAVREYLAAPMPEPVGKVLAEGEMIGYDRRGGNVIWWNKPPGPAMLYAAPPAAPAPVVPNDVNPEYAAYVERHRAAALSAAPVVTLTDDMVEAEFVSRGDDKGQGLHPYWKDAFRDGFNFARSQLSAAPVVREPLTDEQIRNMWDGHTVAAFGRIGINPIVFARAIEKAHGIGGGNG